MKVLIRGGLGNQMFQVALAHVLTAQSSVDPKFIDLTGVSRTKRAWELDCFGITPTKLSPLETASVSFLVATTKRLREAGLPTPKGWMVEGNANLALDTRTPPAIVSGYWQKASYYSEHAEGLRRLFRFPHQARLEQRPIPPDSVALHVRRGDYVSDPTARAHHLVCSPSWYKIAWDQMRSLLPNARALVFSDDPTWARENIVLQGDVEFWESEPDARAYQDMAAMSHCDHFIISNSSYSWWAAWLSPARNKQVIAPRQWYTGVETVTLGICPDGWTLL